MVPTALGVWGRHRWLRVVAAVVLAVAVVSGIGMIVERGRAADVVPPPAAADLDRLLPPDEVARDVAVLVETIEAVHIDPYRHVAKAEFLQAAAAVTKDLEEPISRRAFYRRIAPVVSLLEDGHTVLQLPVDEINAAVRRNHLWFPLGLALADSQATIIANYSTDSAIVHGARLVAINGTPIAEIVHATLGFLSSERPAHRLAALETYLPFYLWLAYEWENDYEVTFLAPGAAAPTVTRVAGRAYRDIRRQQEAATGGAPFRFSSDAGTQTGVLEVAQFADRRAFEGFLEETFADIETQGLRRLIIDVRQNGGGSTNVADALLRYLADQPFRHFARYEMKTSGQVKRQLKGQLPAAIRWLPLQYLVPQGRAVWGVPEGTVIAVEGEYIEPHPPARRFRGDVIVLVGAATFSTASDFAAVVQDFGFATLIGQETGGLACSLGDTYRFRLPHSRLEVGVSFKDFVRPSASCTGRGVLPDHPVPMTADDRAAGRDPAVAYATALPLGS